MAIFTAIAAAIGLTGFFATAFVTVASIATSIGISYIAKALSGNPNGDAPKNAFAGVQGTLQSGADVPRSFNLGYSITAGSLVYANTWGSTVIDGTNTPNAYLTQVIALDDLPGNTLVGLWVNGERCTLGGTPDDRGTPVEQYVKDGQPYLWVKFYDGTQTTADYVCVNYAASDDRPYESTRVGTGVCYAVVTALVNDTLHSGFPQLKFELGGTPLYDPTKDSTNGGSGSHRWSDRSTWGGDGDSLPAVQAYNILRGIYLNGKWLYGLQRMTSARLPAVNWIAQINKCRATVEGEDGSEPTYRTGGQVPVNVQPVQIIESLLTGCQGRLSEIGGFYKIHVGAPDSPTFQFTDDDILSTEEQRYLPFFALADSVNGIQATYPAPTEGWNMKPAPALYNSQYEIEDGSRRLLANPSLDFVPYAAQVQRLQKSALQEARRARRHDLTLPPSFWLVEPGDVGEWTSVRNGYDAKQFRVDGVTDRANLDVLLNLTEVDPTDYDWDHDEDFTPVVSGPTTNPRPAPQGVLDWFAEAFTLLDGSGQPRRPAIRLSWDGSVPGVVGVQYEVRLQSDESSVANGRTDQLAAGALIISQSLIPNTVYQVRGQYIPSSPRDMLWSSWIDVTTPNVKLTLADFDESLLAVIEGVEQYNDEPINEALNKIASIAANQDARNWLDKKEVRDQLSASSENALAQIDEVRVVAVDTEAAFATFSTAATATWGSTTAFVEQSATAIATLDGYAAASYSVTLDVNGYATGFQLVNGGDGIDSFTITTSKFQIVAPGVTGGAAAPIFTVANVNGSPKIALRGDVYADGTFHARAIESGTINTLQLAINSVDILNIIDGAASNSGAATSSTGASPGTAASMTLNVVGGRALIIASVYFASGAGGTATLYVDGVSVRAATADAPVIFVSISTGDHTYGRAAPIVLQAYITGLTEGNHTFRIDSTVGSTDGTIFAINPRR